MANSPSGERALGRKIGSMAFTNPSGLRWPGCSVLAIGVAAPFRLRNGTHTNGLTLLFHFVCGLGGFRHACLRAKLLMAAWEVQRVCSSVGQSAPLIRVRSVVQVHPDPPSSFQWLATGAVAQLGERLPCTQEVRSSILLGSTIYRVFCCAAEMAAATDP